jgi:rhodanese-related sulfurtransferase
MQLPVLSFAVLSSFFNRLLASRHQPLVALTKAQVRHQTHFCTCSIGTSWLLSGSSLKDKIPSLPSTINRISKNNILFSAMSPTEGASKEPPKAGVATPEELQKFVEEAGDRLVVVDVRNPDAVVEPGDQKSLQVGPLPNRDDNVRPKAIHVVWDRVAESMVVPPALLEDKDTPIITHCGGGGRGQMAKEYLEKEYRFTNVINGGGPKETACWNVYGEK